MLVIQADAEDFAQVRGIVDQYCEGLYSGDVEKLRSIFHDDVVLKAPGKRRDMNTWLHEVANRPVPKLIGHRYEYTVLSLDIINDQAMVKLLCPLLDSVFVDFLGLLKEDKKWLIVSKMYAAL
ncbi:MAG: nuclear transport factor 2 family protein [Betaproteobacteria bacterium]|nr:nuclear transport factor 2 family protein [Betaproteobacteria bacterium]